MGENDCGDSCEERYGDSFVGEALAVRLPENRRTRPRLLGGFLNPSWSVPPLCEYGSRASLRSGFKNIKSGLNDLE
jgi:hypothetical protein